MDKRIKKEKMEFTGYEKMENSLSKLTVTKEMEKTKWIVTEKIHGANFSFHINENGVKAARRRAFLTENENFFNHLDAEFMKTCPDKMKELFSAIVKKYPEKNITQVSVWGEIFGGAYMVGGKNLQEDKRISPIQLEVQYTPTIEWVAYDISYKSNDLTTPQEYLDYDIVMELFEAHGIFHLKPLFKGPMNEALNYDLKFDSTIPAIFNMPAFPKGSNIVEGVVAKPVKNLKCKDSYGDNVRAVVKLKNAGFTEMKPVKAKGAGKAKQPPKLVSKIMAYSTEQRLTNAISKHGFPDNEETSKQVVNEFLEDILIDIKQDEDLFAEWNQAPESEKAKIKKSIMGKAQGLINKKLKNSR